MPICLATRETQQRFAQCSAWKRIRSSSSKYTSMVIVGASPSLGFDYLQQRIGPQTEYQVKYDWKQPPALPAAEPPPREDSRMVCRCVLNATFVMLSNCSAIVIRHRLRPRRSQSPSIHRHAWISRSTGLDNKCSVWPVHRRSPSVRNERK